MFPFSSCKATLVKIVSHAEKIIDWHTGGYNALAANITSVMLGQQFEKPEFILESYGNTLHRIIGNHRSYDASDYPLFRCD